MLVAKRDPFELAAHDRPVPHAGVVPTSSRFTRTLNVLQMLGALVAVPVGIGSAYSMYQSNFSVEATCKGLRVNIVRMLDKNVDAGTRHMLVRRDVEAFEQTCGTVDPDATAAFKALLAADKVAPVATAAIPPAEPRSQAIERKAEPAQAVKAEAPLVAKPKQPAAHASAVAPTAVQHEVSDTAWVAAVRSALVKHERETGTATIPATPAPTSLAPPPRTLGELPAPQALPSAPQAAPALPPPAEVATLAPPQADADHPVPPGAIPEADPQDATGKHSRIHEWVGEIPFVGKTLADRVSR